MVKLTLRMRFDGIFGCLSRVGTSNWRATRKVIPSVVINEREQRLLTRRLQAVDEILASCGAAGVLQLAKDAASPRDVGYTLAFVSNEAFRVVDFVTAVYRRPKGKEVVSLLLKSLQEKLPPVLQALHGRLPENDFVTLLLWGPCEPVVWGAAECSEECSDTYWKNVEPSVVSDENTEAVVRRLMKAGRPWAAFGTVEFRVDVLDIRLWAALLQQMAQIEPEHPSEVDDEAIRSVFKIVDASSALTDDEKVRLEFLFVGVLGVRFVGDVSAIPYLDHYVSEHPELFVQALQWQFRREDGKEEDRPLEERERKARWQQSYALLEALRRLPGSDAATAEERAAQLEAWIRAVQVQAEAVSRRWIADRCIGNLLARAPEEDGVWPPAAVCAVLENFRSDEMAKGVYFERMNRFGPHLVDDKGTESLKEAAKYRAWADQRIVEYPFTAVNVLIPWRKALKPRRSAKANRGGRGGKLGSDWGRGSGLPPAVMETERLGSDGCFANGSVSPPCPLCCRTTLQWTTEIRLPKTALPEPLVSSTR